MSPETQNNPTQENSETQGKLTQEQEEKVSQYKAEVEKRAEAEGKTAEDIMQSDKEIQGVLDKYGSDPEALAKAYREMQQGVTKKIEQEKKNRIQAEERAKLLDEQVKFAQQQQQQKPQQTQQDALGALQKQYPNMDEESLKVVYEVSQATAANVAHSLRSDYANQRIQDEINQLESDKMFKRYEDEIMTHLQKMHPSQRMQRGVVKNVKNFVVGQHAQELIEEARNSNPSERGNREILKGGPKGSKGGVSSIGGKGKSLLSERQSQHAASMGLNEKSYNDILQQRRAIAKKNGAPEPDLISDKVLK